jgi:DNA-binding response OmpR family regulator
MPNVPIAETVAPESKIDQIPIPEDTRTSIGSVSPKKLLVADDNEVTLKILSNVLASESYLVLTAKNGLEALKLALQEKPDLILTDYLMPQMDGITLIKKLKSQLTTRYIPVIILSAKAEVDAEVKGIDAGADDYLTKPVNPKRLLTRISSLLRRPAIEES